MQMKSASYMSTIGAALLLLSIACGDDANDSDSNAGRGADDRDGSTAGSGQSGQGSPGGNAGRGGSSAAGGGSTAGDGSSADGGSPDGGSATDGGATTTIPTVLSNAPLDGATNVAINTGVSVTFSEAMDPDTFDEMTFKVTSGPDATVVQGTVVYADDTAVFWPAAMLASSTELTVTITTGTQSASGIALEDEHSWSFTTGASVKAGVPVRLGTSANFAILAKSGISTVPTSAITGDIGVSPAAATYITGFSMTAHSSNVYATAPQVTGKIYAANYGVPTPSNMTTAISDMEIGYTDAAARAPDVTGLGAGDIGGMTLTPGVYKWSTGLLIPSDVTLTGGPTEVWIFQIAGNLTVSNGKHIELAGGALSKNVFWQVAGQAVLGTTVHHEGTLLSKTSIKLGTGASINGRLLAQTAVMIDSSTVVQPAK